MSCRMSILVYNKLVCHHVGLKGQEPERSGLKAGPIFEILAVD